jgi:hypothetical protein
MYVLPHKQFLRQELDRILRAHRNHPSFLSLAFGNEFNLDWLSTDAEKKEFLETVADFHQLAKSIDPARLILSNDGYLMRPTDMVSMFRDPPGDVPAVRPAAALCVRAKLPSGDRGWGGVSSTVATQVGFRWRRASSARRQP